jgi:hypothetical protein
MKKVLSLCCLMCLIITSGCTLYSLQGTGLKEPISLTAQTGNSSYVQVKHFQISRGFTGSQTENIDIRGMVCDAGAGIDYDAIVNLKIKFKQTFGDGCITMFGIEAIHVELEGDLVKLKEKEIKK